MENSFGGIWPLPASKSTFIDFTGFECHDKMACFDLKGSFCLAFKNFLCRIVQKLYCIYSRKVDILLFLLVGKLWLKAVYQVVFSVPEICQFLACQKSVK